MCIWIIVLWCCNIFRNSFWTFVWSPKLRTQKISLLLLQTTSPWNLLEIRSSSVAAWWPVMLCRCFTMACNLIIKVASWEAAVTGLHPLSFRRNKPSAMAGPFPGQEVSTAPWGPPRSPQISTVSPIQQEQRTHGWDEQGVGAFLLQLETERETHLTVEYSPLSIRAAWDKGPYQLQTSWNRKCNLMGYRTLSCCSPNASPCVCKRQKGHKAAVGRTATASFFQTCTRSHFPALLMDTLCHMPFSGGNKSSTPPLFFFDN